MTEDIVQGTPEWNAIRLGKATASRIADIIASGKNGQPSASRANYLAQLLCERLTGVPQDSYQSAEMERGTETEAEARAAYTFRTGNSVALLGFAPHPAIEMSGASPDGLVGTDGLVQFKCPNTATHIDTLRRGVIQGRYLTQMQWEMACSGRQWCDFVSFDPRLPESMTLAILRVKRDEPRIVELTAAVRDFLSEVDATITELRARYEGPGLMEQLRASLDQENLAKAQRAADYLRAG